MKIVKDEKPSTIFAKKLHRRCLTGFLLRLFNYMRKIKQAFLLIHANTLLFVLLTLNI